MKEQRKVMVRMTIDPAMAPLIGVLTPQAFFIADPPKAAVTGGEPVKDPRNWQNPRAIISCEAAIFLFPA